VNESDQSAAPREATDGSAPLTVAQAWRHATADYEGREWGRSEQWCRRIVAAQADHLGALHLLGIIAAQTDRLAEAAALLERAVALRPQHAATRNDLGNVLLRMRRIEEALASYECALQLEPLHAEAHSNRGNALADLGRLEAALASYERALQLRPQFVEAHNNRGNALRRLGRLDEALASYEYALLLDPKFVAAHNNRGTTLHDLGRASEALECYERALALSPQFAEAYNNRGIALEELGSLQDSLAAFDHALQLNGGFAEAHNNRGNVLRKLERAQDAMEAYERALQLKPSFAEAHNNRGNALRDLGRLEEALSAFECALQTQPDFVGAYANRGNVLRELRRLDDALEQYRSALRIAPQFAEGHNGLGNVLHDLGRRTEALESYQRALGLHPESADIHNNCGHVLRELRRFDEALGSYERALRLDPERPWLFGTWLHTKMQICSWAGLEDSVSALESKLADGRRAAPPFSLLAVTDSLAVQRQAAELWNAAYTPRQTLPPTARGGSRRERIRLAYISGDLRDHALAYLMVGAFEQHDRRRFDVLGISPGPKANTAFGRRVAGAFDEFIDISGKSDREAAELLRQMRIDIAVDLMGMTLGRRLGLFAQRGAPVQVSYLGFPGTLGAPYMDYLLADEFVIPPASRPLYSEAVVYLPECFQANDDRRPIANEPISRGAVGLPESAFVYCSFNNSYKITPQMFAAWCRLLAAQPRSVLWMLAESDRTRQNVLQELRAHEIDPARVLFAEREPYARHLARLRLADLFLDTFPFNGGTTASDALWAGLPVLTCCGEAFAARMAGSLLRTTGLPELITSSLTEYERRGRELAASPAELAALRSRLAANLQTSPLFKTRRFCDHLEQAYSHMYERFLAGAAPEGFTVPAVPHRPPQSA
jgi:protein O-GlcNAc transferase